MDAQRTQVEYFDFVASKLGQWEDTDAFTLAAARFNQPGEARNVTVVVWAHPHQWTASADRHAAKEELIKRARHTRDAVLGRWRVEVRDEPAGDIVIAFDVDGRPTPRPPAGWGQGDATCRPGALPRPVS